MARRSAKLLRFENTLYKYNTESQAWTIDSINLNQVNILVDLFEKGSSATCKHMSQKVNPISLRKGFLNTWDSIPYINYKESNILENTFYFELFIQSYIKSILKNFGSFFDKIEIKKTNDTFYINIFFYSSGNMTKKNTVIPPKLVKRFKSLFSDLTYATKKDEENNIYYNPFFIEGSSGLKGKTYVLDTIKLSMHLEKYLSLYSRKKIKIAFQEQNSIGNSATLLSNFLSYEIEKSNANFKRALRDTFKEIKNKSKIKGIRINCSGRLGKAPMAKTEWFKYGQIPLSRINANLDYSSATSFTKYGSIGVKVWIYYHN
jgi:ribosomal protein S3